MDTGPSWAKLLDLTSKGTWPLPPPSVPGLPREQGLLRLRPRSAASRVARPYQPREARSRGCHSSPYGVHIQ